MTPQIECLEVFGDELTIVNAARVSFGKQKTVLDEADERLIRYLITHRHYSPFRHVFFRFRIRAPEMIMRQWYKHVVGCEWGHGGQLHGWNELSGRYVRLDEDAFFYPSEWRAQSRSKKQGSDGVVGDQELCHEVYRRTVRLAHEAYETLLDQGVAVEQARLLLPVCSYTETIWTASLQAVLHFISLRLEPHAQQEIREYAAKMYEIVQRHCPLTCRYWQLNDITPPAAPTGQSHGPSQGTDPDHTGSGAPSQKPASS